MLDNGAIAELLVREAGSATGSRENPHQLFENYKALVTPTNAKRYWLLSPVAAGNVVKMPKAS